MPPSPGSRSAAAVLAPSAPARTSDTALNLVAYSTPREAYGQLIPMFQKTAAGKDVSFTQSYGASGEQTRAMKAGLKADIVALSLAPDMDELVKAGLVSRAGRSKSYSGMVTDSLVVFVLRDGNPKKIKTWNDLLQAGHRGRHAEPVHVGRRPLEHHGGVRRVARERQDRQAGAGEPAQAVQERRRPGQERARLAEHVHRAARATCFSPTRTRRCSPKLKGLDLQFVIPRSTILIENPIAVTRTTEHAKEANAFLRFLKTPAAQQVFANNGYRPVVKKVLETNRKKFPPRPGEFTIDAVDRRLGEGAEALLRSEDRRHGEDRERRSVATLASAPRVAPRPARAKPHRTGPQRPCPSAS